MLTHPFYCLHYFSFPQSALKFAHCKAKMKIYEVAHESFNFLKVCTLCLVFFFFFLRLYVLWLVHHTHVGSVMNCSECLQELPCLCVLLLRFLDMFLVFVQCYQCNWILSIQNLLSLGLHFTQGRVVSGPRFMKLYPEQNSSN